MFYSSLQVLVFHITLCFESRVILEVVSSDCNVSLNLYHPEYGLCGMRAGSHLAMRIETRTM